MVLDPQILNRVRDYDTRMSGIVKHMLGS